VVECDSDLCRKCNDTSSISFHLAPSFVIIRLLGNHARSTHREVHLLTSHHHAAENALQLGDTSTKLLFGVFVRPLNKQTDSPVLFYTANRSRLQRITPTVVRIEGWLAARVTRHRVRTVGLSPFCVPFTNFTLYRADPIARILHVRHRHTTNPTTFNDHEQVARAARRLPSELTSSTKLSKMYLPLPPPSRTRRTLERRRRR